MAILPNFRDEARRRGLLGADEAVTLDRAYRLVRDMAFGQPSDNRPETVIAEWRGLSDTKHDVLALLLEELGYDVAPIVATMQHTAESASWLPPHIVDELKRAPIRDVITFLRVRTDPVADDWTTMDATWPEGAKHFGAPANGDFVAGVDQRTAGVPEEIVHVQGDEDAIVVAARLLVDFAGDDIGRRMGFIDAISTFLGWALAPVEGDTDGW